MFSFKELCFDFVNILRLLFGTRYIDRFVDIIFNGKELIGTKLRQFKVRKVLEQRHYENHVFFFYFLKSKHHFNMVVKIKKNAESSLLQMTKV